MSVASIAALERQRLCDLMLQLGPDAPTIDEGWAVLDLAAHLVIREHDLWAAAGIVVGGPFHWLLEAAMERRRRQGLDHLVGRIRSGPPTLARLAPAGAHLIEYFIHQEDMRRAHGLPPRAGLRDLDEALARLLRAGAPFALRKVEVGLDLVWNGGVLSRRGPEPRAVVSGPPGEILLYMSGRRRVATVEVSGDSEAMTRLRSADLRI